jgi:starvation-inducible DNA-binding protein
MSLRNQGAALRMALTGEHTMYKSPSHLSPDARARIALALDALLADGLDLHGQIKVAHWNLKGPHFAALHPLFETFATALAMHNDAIAERAVTLGAVAHGTVRHVARVSRIAEYPQDTVRDLEHVRLLAERFDVYLDGVRAARRVAEDQADADSVDLVTRVAGDFEKNAWFLRASVEG